MYMHLVIYALHLRPENTVHTFIIVKASSHARSAYQFLDTIELLVNSIWLAKYLLLGQEEIQ
jgi:hypothetical protein